MKHTAQVGCDLSVLSDEDRKYIDTEVRAAFPEMETHLEIFPLPSGATLHLWCDGTYNLLHEQPGQPEKEDE